MVFDVLRSQSCFCHIFSWLALNLLLKKSKRELYWAFWNIKNLHQFDLINSLLLLMFRFNGADRPRAIEWKLEWPGSGLQKSRIFHEVSVNLPDPQTMQKWSGAVKFLFTTSNTAPTNFVLTFQNVRTIRKRCGMGAHVVRINWKRVLLNCWIL